MFNYFFSLFIFSELSFYLLIAQTGIVEVFNSNLLLIAYLPIGGIIGTYLSSHINIQKHFKLTILLFLQTLLILFYPDYNSFGLFLLGFAVGGISPLIISKLKSASSIDLLVSLSSSYTFGTLFFNFNPYERELLGVLLSLCAFIGYLFSQKNTTNELFYENSYTFPLYTMLLWVFLDSTLFETLSRDTFIPIWRGDYTLEIILFHIFGIITAVAIKLKKHQVQMIITFLFIVAYIFYYIKEPLLLSIVYPFVISYYNITILQTLIQIKELRKIGIYMIFIGWIASGLGLFTALGHFIGYISIILIIMLIQHTFNQFNLTKKGLLWSKD